MTQTLWLPVILPGMNQLVARDVRSKIRIKRESRETVCLFIASAKLRPVARAFIRYEWRAPDKRRDPSNIAAGGRKVIEDALQAAGILSNDGWAAIAGFSDTFAVDRKAPGCLVTIESLPTRDTVVSF